MIYASYMRQVHQAAMELRRERAYADARERPITAELNLVQLQGGRERAAEIAQRQLRRGA